MDDNSFVLPCVRVCVRARVRVYLLIVEFFFCLVFTFVVAENRQKQQENDRIVRYQVEAKIVDRLVSAA